MMSVTLENNLSETAFAVKEQDVYHLRWFTPGGEIDLCGHATLACAYVIFRFYETDWDSVDFLTKSGKLTVRKEKITAYQASARSGILYCRMEGDRVVLGGKAALYAISDICVDTGLPSIRVRHQHVKRFGGQKEVETTGFSRIFYIPGVVRASWRCRKSRILSYTFKVLHLGKSTC